MGDYWQFFNMTTFLISAHIFSSLIYKHFAHLGHRYGKLSYLYISKSNYTLKYSRNNIYRYTYNSNKMRQVQVHENEPVEGGWGEADVIPTHWHIESPRQNGRHFPDNIFNIFKCIFLCENMCTALKIPKVWIICIPALVHIIIWASDG